MNRAPAAASKIESRTYAFKTIGTGVNATSGNVGQPESYFNNQEDKSMTV
jgi:hypothetical protein